MESANKVISNINIDSAVTSILSKFETDYINHVIDDSLKMRFRPYGQPMPNIIFAYEQQFKYNMDAFPGNKNQIDAVRLETYVEIITRICNFYNLEFNQQADQDYYSTAYFLYDILISNFTDNLINFFVYYILKEKNALYEQLNLSLLKKNKDSSTSYSKKLFKNVKISTIHANVGYVIDNICCQDIGLFSVLDTLSTSENSNIVKYLEYIISDKGDIFKNYFAPFVMEDFTKPDIITLVKLKLQEVAANDIDITTTFNK